MMQGMGCCRGIAVFVVFAAAVSCAPARADEPAAETAAPPAAKLPAAAGRAVDFVKDVQPILAGRCLKCHGPELTESGYRVDVKSVALKGGDAYAPNILPGKSAESPLIQLVAGQIEGSLMPAKGPPLSAEQIGILRAWIDQGASWPDEASATLEDPKAWWSLQPLARVAVPALPPIQNPKSKIQNPLDAFIQAKLADQGLVAAPPADKRTLLRRVTYDFTGLPPTPAEIDAFLADAAPDAYERLVDRLLASPRHGERWARHWMDAAHFAETHGHDQDRIRENAWPYRDYLIRSYNADTPYGRFIEEQVAADSLYPDDAAATAALGFLAAGPWDESTLKDIREDTLDRQIGRYLDRDDMLTNVLNNVCSLTVQCARCHDHKFDPIPQSDYYALQAVFAGVERANRKYDADPAVGQRRRQLAERKARLESADPAVAAELLSPAAQAAVAEWESGASSRLAAWRFLTPETFTSSGGATLTKQSDDSLLSGGPKPEKDTVAITAAAPLTLITALRLEVLTDDSLPQRGPGRQDNGNLHLSEIQVFAGDAPTADTAAAGAAPAPLALSRAIADFDQAGWDITRAIDGNEATAWGIHPAVGQAHEAVFELKEPLKLPEGGKLTVVLKQLHGSGHLIGRARLSVTGIQPPVQLGGPPAPIAAILAVAPTERTDEQRIALARHQQLEQLAAATAALPKPSLIYAAASDFEPEGGLRPPPIHMLRRGDIRQPLAEAQPGALSCVAFAEQTTFDLPPGHREADRRAALARWLTHKGHPLTWRSIVNRVWHHHFSRGIVETPNDFGRMGARPTHPELLDWLAADFLRRGQSLKTLSRLIVTSGTYRQSSGILDFGSPILDSEQGPSVSTATNPKSKIQNPKLIDADNALLWRMHRTRLDAECIRDAVLAMADRLDLRMGGPSDRQFDLQPGRHVTPLVDYNKFDVDSPAGQRRSVYRFLFRTLPDPFMEALDCPAGDQITPVRTNTVTVQQALALWNDAFLLRQCEHLAARLKREQPTPAGQVALAFRLALCREATPAETAQFAAYAERHGLANFCRVLLNSNEFVFVE